MMLYRLYPAKGWFCTLMDAWNDSTELKGYIPAIKNASDVEAMRDKTSLIPIDWWNFRGWEIPNIQKLGIMILSQVASSLSTERNWSTYGFIHSMKRNRLGSKTVE